MTTCPECGTSGQPDGARFCFSCGGGLQAATCPACAAEVVPGARFCSSCGAVQEAVGATPAPANQPPVSARRVTSVLFGDLVGFTSLSETRDQEDVRELLSRYFDECRQVIDRYGGTVEKFIGDAVMAVWGVPTVHEDDAERAVRAGLELVDAISQIGEEVGVPDLAMRVGIVTGEVAVTLGAHQQGMVAGDAVNTAARVQSAATPGQVWVDETTRLLTSSAITYLDMGSHAMKGKTEAMPLWAVVAVVAAVGGAQRADGLEAPHVGRDRELRLVKELFHRVQESGNPALVVIEGEAGLGKSRLAWEFEKYIDGLTATVMWHKGRCLAYGEGVAFYALAEAIRGRLQLLREDPSDNREDDQAALLALGLERYAADAEERAWLEPRLGALLGIGAVGQFPREDLFSAWITFLNRVGQGERAVVLVIEDAHHADDGLAAFLENLLVVASFPCFVMLMTRPGMLERRAGLVTDRRATVLHLETLSDAHMGSLLDGLVPSLPDRARASLIERAEGVPLFAVETVRSLIDRDLVVPRGGQYVLADPDGLDLDTVGAPASLQALIAARLDTLSVEQRRVLDQASVVGTSFERSVLEQLCADVADLDDVLASLVRLQLLRQESSRWSSELGQYQFVQSVVRQVAYGMLARRDRKGTHLAVVELLRADDSADLAPIVAGHLLAALDAVPHDEDEAALTSAAVDELRRAARRAGSLGAPGEAAGHLEVALARATDPVVQREVEADLADLLVKAARYDEAAEHAAHARDACLAAGDEIGAGGAAATLGWALTFGASDSTRDFERAGEIGEGWRDRLAGADGADRVLLALNQLLVSVAIRTGGDVLTPATENVRLAALVGSDADIADSYIALGIAYQLTGLQGPGEVLIGTAIDRARQARDPRSLTRALMNSNATLLGQDCVRAAEFGREAVKVAMEAGDVGWIGGSVANLAVALYALGAWDEVQGYLTEYADMDVMRWLGDAVQMEIAHARLEPIEGSDAGPDPSLAHYTKVMDARLLEAQGRPDEAARLAVEAAQFALDVGGLFDDFTHVWLAALELARSAGDDDVARELLAILDQETRHRPPVGCRAGRSRELARLAIAAGEPAATVEEHFRDAVTFSQQWQSRPHLAHCRADYGVWLATQGRSGEAEVQLTEARDTFEALRATRWLAELDRQLAGAARR